MQDNPESFIRIFFFLYEEDKAYKDNVDRPYAPHWNILKATLKSDEAFQITIQRLSDETRKAEVDQDYRKRLNCFYEEMLTHFVNTFPIEAFQKLDSSKLGDVSAALMSVFRSVGKL